MDSKPLPKSTSRKIISKPLKDLSINISDSPLSRNPTTVQFTFKKPLLTPKPPATAPSTPRQSSIPGCKTPRLLSSKIKSPSDYVFSTHNHSRKFALTPKRSETKPKPSQTPKSTPDRQAEHLFNTFQAMKLSKFLRTPTSEEIQTKELRLTKPKGYERKKTVIFDLDETLVHCVSSPELGQVELEIQMPSGAPTKVGINIRPYAKELLTAISKEFEVVVFTASHKCYADKVIDLLDPGRVLVHHRLYRNNCIPIDGIFVKDLRIFLDRSVKDLIIVDNAAYSFAFQVLNGIPIISWYDDLEDRELFKLIEYLRVLGRVEDIRVVNQFTFHLDSFYEDYSKDFKVKNEKENAGN